MNDAMTDTLAAKLKQGRPVRLTAEETEVLTQALREAMATTLDVPVTEVGDDALVFDDLGLDSIDVFDILDQLSERFEVSIELEALPEGLLRGEEATTFRRFAEGLLRYFREPPAPPKPA